MFTRNRHILKTVKDEGEVAFFSAKRWDRRNRADLIESATPCHDAQVAGPYRDSNPLRLTILAGMSEDYTTAPQHLQKDATVAKFEPAFTRCRFQNVPVRVPFSKPTVFKVCRQKMCRFRVNGRPIRHMPILPCSECAGSDTQGLRSP